MHETLLLCAVSSLALVSNTENANQFENRIVAINCYVACRTRGNNQFPTLTVDAPPDQRVDVEYLYRGAYPFERTLRRRRRASQHELDDSLEVQRRRLRIDYLGHRTGLGRPTGRP